MGDQYDAATVLLLHMNGTNNSTTFTDSSPQENSMTKGGDAKISTSQYKFGTASAYFDGSGDAIRLVNSNYAIGTKDFTFEFWVYPINGGHGNSWCRLFETALWANTGGCNCVLTSSDNPAYIRFEYNSAGGKLIDSSSTIPNDAWTHVAICGWGGDTTALFINGTKQGSELSYNYNSTAYYFSIGSNNSGGESFYGYIDDFRFTLGYARYQESFTAPTSEYSDPSGFAGMLPVPISCHPEFSGNYQIVGTVDRLGLVGSYKIRLFDRQTGICVGDTFSNSAGAYAFTGLAYKANRYFVVAYDHSGTPLNAAIADLITPELMT